MAQVSKLEGFDYAINEEGIMTEVMDQKDQGCCLAIVLADIVSMVMRISKKDRHALVSAQPLIDSNATTVAKMRRFSVVFGLESEETYPLTRVERDWDESLYLIRREKRYKLHDLMSYESPDDIRNQIMMNFGKTGKRYPLLGAMNFKDFNAEKALDLVERKVGFSLLKNPKRKRKGRKRKVEEEEKDQEEHALLIYGCNTTLTEKDTHYCYVKNSHDKTWGDKGCSLVCINAFKYILVPIYDVLPPTKVYVALPSKTVDAECEFDENFVLDNTLEKLKQTGADGVSVNVLWGVVERSSKKYKWSGYKKLFEALKNNHFKIQVVLCFHEVVDGDFIVSLPQWVLDIGEEDPNIFFKDEQKSFNRECLSWGIDDKKVLKDRTALEVYSEFMKSFQSTFKELLEEKVISSIEIGLGPKGELRYPSFCSKRGWIYPGVGAFQCYDDYMLNSLKEKAVQDQYGFYDKAPEIGVTFTYNLNPKTCDFFQKDKLDSLESRYFLNWYAQQLIKHGNQVLSEARSIFGYEILINAKLSGIHWWYTDEGESHAAELTAGFFNSYKHDGYCPFLKMLKANKIGLNVTVQSYDLDSTQPVSSDPDKWMEEVTNAAADMASHPDFVDEDPVPISTWNAEPCVDKTSYQKALQKALKDKQKTTCEAFTFYGFDQLINEPKQFADFVRKMHVVEDDSS